MSHGMRERLMAYVFLCFFSFVPNTQSLVLQAVMQFELVGFAFCFVLKP